MALLLAFALTSCLPCGWCSLAEGCGLCCSAGVGLPQSPLGLSSVFCLKHHVKVPRWLADLWALAAALQVAAAIAAVVAADIARAASRSSCIILSITWAGGKGGADNCYTRHAGANSSRLLVTAPSADGGVNGTVFAASGSGSGSESTSQLVCVFVYHRLIPVHVCDLEVESFLHFYCWKLRLGFLRQYTKAPNGISASHGSLSRALEGCGGLSRSWSQSKCFLSAVAAHLTPNLQKVLEGNPDCVASVFTISEMRALLR
eukprot:2531630-Amphidinium_carterae.1